MATVALYAVGGILGAATFGAGTVLAGVVAGAGALAGSYIDQNYLYPLLQKPTGQRLKNIPVTGTDEGSPVDYCLGPQNRVGGTAIWLSNLLEHKKSAGGKGGPSSTVYEYSVHAAIGVCDVSDGDSADILMIWADSKVIYRNGKWDKSKIFQVTLYDGSTSQDADPLMQALLGIDKTPAYRGQCYVVFNDFQLQDYGNRVPNFTFLVQRTAHLSVRAAIRKLAGRCGLSDANLDLARCPGNLYGYTISGPQSGVQSIEPLMTANDLVTQETGGVLRFLQMGLEDQVPVDADALGSHAPDESGSSIIRPIQISDVPDYQLPKVVNVQYLEPSKNWLKASQNEKKLVDMGGNTLADFTGVGSFYAVQSIDLPLVMGAKDARRIAYNRLWRAHVERQTVEIHLPPSYLCIQENDVLIIPLSVGGSDNLIFVRLTEVNIGNNFVIVCQGVITQTRALSDLPAECSSDNDLGDVYSPITSLDLVLLDIPALQDSDTTTPTLYYATAPTDPAAPFRGAILFSSTDDSNWNEVTEISLSADMGIATTTLGIGPVGYWDREATVTIFMESGELTSTDEASVRAGANTLYVGKEIVGFTTATLVSANTYKVSGLLRGLRNTSPGITSHITGESVVVLSRSSVGKLSLNSSNIGTSAYFRSIPSGGNVDDYISQYESYEGNCLKQFSVCHLSRSDDPTSGDITFSWVRRTRALTNTLRGPWPLLSSDETYELDILDGGGNVVRTASSISSPTFDYTAAMQSTDSYVSGPINVIVYQLSDQIGRGFPAKATL